MDLRVVRVNGVDVTDSSQEEILTLIAKASKPITLEVNNENHRNDNDRNNSETAGVKLTFTKNAREINNIRETEIQTEAERSLCDNCRDFYNSFYNYNYDIFPLEPDTEENFIYPDLQYEEIELKRPSGNPSELLGLTLCYEDEDSDGNTEIFIDDIHPDGLAARDGRLRLGDQIIQINGERVRSKSRSQDMFRSLRGDIKLLVVRPPQTAYEHDLDLSTALKLSRTTDSDPDDHKNTTGNKNRLLSNSSKDSGNNSGSIDGSSTGSSKSSASSNKEKEELFPSAKDDMITKVTPKFNSNSTPGQYLDSCKLPKSSTGDCIYTTDSEFYFIDGENCRNSRDFSEFYHHQEIRSSKVSNNVKNNLLDSGPVVIDPVYEIIPEVLSESDDLYCLPQDSKHVNDVNISVANKLDNNKFRLKTGGDKIRSICRSISSPMRMNEQSETATKVKRSASSYKQPGQAELSSNIVYTNINNLERTMRDQQERLLSQFHNNHHHHQSKPPQFTAPPPPQHPPPTSGSDKNEKSSSFPAGADQHWQWRIKVRPDGSRYIARRPTKTFLLKQREKQIAEERNGFTTDDDNASEVKVGKFWTKEQKKKHLDDSRERRKRQEEVIVNKNATTSKLNNNSDLTKRLSLHEPSSTSQKNNEIVLTVATV